MTQAALSMDFVMGRAPVIPVLAIEDLTHAVPLARALSEGGLSVLEITLRTAVALPALEAIAKELPAMIIGVGTYTQPEQARAASDAGAAFLVSPGITEAVLAGADRVGLPLLPGVSTASELMRASEAEIDHLKFFPAESSGGVNALKAMAGPFPNVRFCPTGGITSSNYLNYLSLPNVLCVGGSWVAPPAALAAHDWARVRSLAAAAVANEESWYSVVGEEDPGSVEGVR